MARTGERDEGEVKGVVSHNSNGRNELIRLRGNQVTFIIYTKVAHKSAEHRVTFGSI